MLRVGILGIGFMGRIHYLAYQQARGAKVIALSTRDPKKRAGDWRRTTGNFGPPGAVFDLGDIRRYAHRDELLADPEVDVIDICLPPADHAAAALAAFRAGKHVFCEKPLALTPQDATRMVRAAKQAGRLLLTGHVLPFFAEYAYVLQAVEKQSFGKLLGGHFHRLISDPTWLEGFYDPQHVGGPVVDLHIHDAHFIRLLFGMPHGVFSRGTRRGDVVQRWQTQFLFADPQCTVSALGGVIAQQGRSFTHGFELWFQRATLVYDFAVLDGQPHPLQPLTVIPQRGRCFQPKLQGGDPLVAFTAQIGEVVRSIRSGRTSAILGGDLARDALLLCQRQTESVFTERTVKI